MKDDFRPNNVIVITNIYHFLIVRTITKSGVDQLIGLDMMVRSPLRKNVYILDKLINAFSRRGTVLMYKDFSTLAINMSYNIRAWLSPTCHTAILENLALSNSAPVVGVA